MMRVLVVQNYEGTEIGQVGTALDEAGAQIETIKAYLGEDVPEAATHDAIVVLGGGQNALADDESPWLPKLCSLMRQFSESDRSVMGICLGSQLLARAYNAENIIGGASEFGWREVGLTPEGRDDPLFEGVGTNFRTYQWHSDTFVLPRGAQRLAGNLVAHNQAFRIGRATYGVQFHFEADRALVAQWSTVLADYLDEHHPAWNQGLHEEEASLYGSQADETGLTIARNWVRTIKSS